MTVRTGLFGANESFVPLKDATLANGELRVPYSKDVIKDAPNFDAEHHLDVEDENRLYEHYKLQYTPATNVDRTDANRNVANPGVATDGDRVDVNNNLANPGVSERDFDRTNVDRKDIDGDTVVRREERLNVGKEEQVAGKAHLRKHVVTENQTVEVPVQKEVLTVEREPIADGEQRNVGRIGDGDDVDQEITLREERVNVNKETVGVEKVHVGKDVVNDTETVSEEIRKEQVDVDQDGRNVTDRDFDRTVTDRNVTDRDLKDGTVHDDRNPIEKAKDAVDGRKDGK